MSAGTIELDPARRKRQLFHYCLVQPMFSFFSSQYPEGNGRCSFVAVVCYVVTCLEMQCLVKLYEFPGIFYT